MTRTINVTKCSWFYDHLRVQATAHHYVANSGKETMNYSFIRYETTYFRECHKSNNKLFPLVDIVFFPTFCRQTSYFSHD